MNRPATGIVASYCPPRSNLWVVAGGEEPVQGVSLARPSLPRQVTLRRTDVKSSGLFRHPASGSAANQSEPLARPSATCAGRPTGAVAVLEGLDHIRPQQRNPEGAFDRREDLGQDQV